jgi:nitric oxide reductase subunit B
MRYRGHWVALGVVIVGSFAVLGWFGFDIYQKAPPIPDRVVTTDGRLLFTGEDILDGQNAWQAMGGQEVGSIWGHGSYVAPDWTADWLHREATFMVDRRARRDLGTPYAELAPPEQAAARAMLQQEVRRNTFDPGSGTLTVSPLRAEAIAHVASHYDGLFGSDPALEDLREAYAIPRASVPDPERRADIAAFFFWTSWAAVTERPGEPVTYTQNWPPEDLVGNAPTGSIVVWSVVSFVLLLAGIGALAWYFAAKHGESELPEELPREDPLLGLHATPSMRATLKYFWVAGALLVVQVLLGAVTAHYGVEGTAFYGFPLAEVLPYSVTRTWHVQLGIFWIATAWLATGLFLAPAVSGKEPRFQRAGVNFLFVCLLVIVVGSMFGVWLGTRQGMTFEANFWFGHQGYEYVDIGRFWQIFLFVGLFLWLGLMVRAMWPAFRVPGANRHLLALFLIASGAIALFYGAGLMWGQRTHLAMAEYWRWWVVHLWVEGFFEVFATVAIAFLFARMGLLDPKTGAAAVRHDREATAH